MRSYNCKWQRGSAVRSLSWWNKQPSLQSSFGYGEGRRFRVRWRRGGGIYFSTNEIDLRHLDRQIQSDHSSMRSYNCKWQRGNAVRSLSWRKKQPSLQSSMETGRAVALEFVWRRGGGGGFSITVEFVAGDVGNLLSCDVSWSLGLGKRKQWVYRIDRPPKWILLCLKWDTKIEK